MDVDVQGTGNTHINILPPETLGQVLRKLSVVDRLHCERVNPRWKTIVRDFGWIEQRKLTRDIVCDETGPSSRLKPKIYYKNKFYDEFLKALFSRIGANLIELDLSSFFTTSTQWHDREIFRSFHLLPNLAKLDIRRNNFMHVVKFLPATLIELHSDGPFGEESLTMLSENCPNIESLFFSKRPCKISVRTMNAFVGKYPRLKILQIHGNFIASDEVASLTSLGQLHQLEELHLESVEVFDDAALTAVVTGCRRLRNLTIDNTRVSGEAIRELENLPQLINLEIKNHPNLSKTILKQIEERWKIKKCKILLSRMSTDDSVLREALKEIISVSKMLKPAYIDDLIKWGLLPVLVESLGSKNAELRFQATWVLTNITAGSPDQTSAVVHAKAVPKLLQLVEIEGNWKTRVQSLWTLGNIIGNRSTFRDYCIDLGVVERLHKIVMTEQASITILQHIAWVFSVLCSHTKSPLSMDLITQSILPALGKLLQNNDDVGILKDSVWAISHIAFLGTEQIQRVCDLGVVPQLVQMLGHSDVSVQAAAIRAVGRIASGTDEQTQLLLDSGALKMVPDLLLHPISAIVTDTVWFLSNVAAGSDNQVQAVFHTGLVPSIVQILVRCRDTQKEAVWALTNLAIHGRSEYALYLTDQGVIPPLCNLLADSYLAHEILDALKNILEKAGTRTDEICEKIKRCGGLDKIKQLRNHFSAGGINKIAHEIIDNFFTYEAGI